MTLKELDVDTKRQLIQYMFCGRRCMSCGYFVDYTGRCKLNSIFNTNPLLKTWITENLCNGSLSLNEPLFIKLLDELEFKECLNDARASGVFIKYDEKMNLCDGCPLIRFCQHPERGHRMGDVRKEY